MAQKRFGEWSVTSLPIASKGGSANAAPAIPCRTERRLIWAGWNIVSLFGAGRVTGFGWQELLLEKQITRDDKLDDVKHPVVLRL